MTQALPMSIEQDRDEPGLVHEVHDGNDNLALCGKDVSADEWTEVTEPTTCAECARLSDAHYETPFCVDCGF